MKKEMLEHVKANLTNANTEIEDLKRQLDEAKKAAEWTPIDAKHLPKMGDEVGGWDTDSEGLLIWYFRGADDYEQLGDDLVAIADMGAENWSELILTHYRPVTPPEEQK